MGRFLSYTKRLSIPNAGILGYCAARPKTGSLLSHLSGNIHQERRCFSSVPSTEKLTVPIEHGPGTANADASRLNIELGLPLDNKSIKRSNRGNRTIKNSLPPSLQYVRDTMDKYKDFVVLTQMGSFYELYFEHADIYAPKLNLTLTSREYAHGKVSFAGFPVQQVNRHLKVLVKELGYSVAIADQFKRTSAASNESNRFLRRVTRIVTPGTFLDEAFENLQENTYLLSIEFPESCVQKLVDINMKVGLCWCDISTGEIFVQQTLLKDTISAVARIGPREILLDEELFSFKLEEGEWYPEFVELKRFFIKYQKMPSNHRSMNTFRYLFNSGYLEGDFFRLENVLHDFSQKEVAALRNMLLYIEEHLPDTAVNLQEPQRQLTNSLMQIDSRSCSALEITSTMRANTKKGSLLSAIKRTVTPSGSRLLSQWLSAPSLDTAEIKRRQQLVTLFRNNHELTELLIRTLKQTYDMPRILQKFSFGKGDATELLQLSHSLQKAEFIGKSIKAKCRTKQGVLGNILSSVISPLEYDKQLIGRVLSSLDEDQLMKFTMLQSESESELCEKDQNLEKKDVDAFGESSLWVIRPGAGTRISELHGKHQELLKRRRELCNRFESTISDSVQVKGVQLRLRHTGEYGLYISATSTNIKLLCSLVKDGMLFRGSPLKILQKSSQSCWLDHRLWTELGQELEYIVMKIKREENIVISSFKKEFIKKSFSIRRVSQVLDYLDVLTSFAKLSTEKNLSCPVVDTSSDLDIKSGRHIVVEDGLLSKSLQKFTSNDCRLEASNLWVITGPNMGGKSTFLRQIAIIVIMAQIGSYVPCESAKIGVVDKIFSRIGSADDLYNQMSTFMVEMTETGYILKGATKRSLAILDEIGRGTSGKEGISLAYAALKYLVDRNQCRSLFATHFGQELKTLVDNHCDEAVRKKISYYRSGVYDTGGDDFCYDHSLTPGICNNSDAIRVAMRAGFPKEALDNARKALKLSDT
ncbi:mismatch repair ATPase MSH1 [Lachancea thermotolerans CBS 6340]|uniref:KLTH0B05302p n=1 Tax=Lachancea thermotolerans (strain ATCC 56472 / CBS 6340 / NRRL Y-8284) TaxID=559295 RepID=C5DCR9_LACTC|nr:KLTH0B05302p [Lachancea thermotolerans CBS 6340]CAR21580.1 KLTH0B05302p [Lachancea thermotolerans CBS 6340]